MTAGITFYRRKKMFEEQIGKVEEKADSFLAALIKSKLTWAALAGVFVLAVIF
jgi:hypothetical protein